MRRYHLLISPDITICGDIDLYLRISLFRCFSDVRPWLTNLTSLSFLVWCFRQRRHNCTHNIKITMHDHGIKAISDWFFRDIIFITCDINISTHSLARSLVLILISRVIKMISLKSVRYSFSIGNILFIFTIAYQYVDIHD